MNVNCLLFNDFETLDLFGPVEVFGKVEEYNINYYSMNGGTIISKQNTQIITENINAMDLNGILIIPGGKGTRTLVDLFKNPGDDIMTAWKREKRQRMPKRFFLNGCTG